ncbi:DHH family phosphoesterase [Candidatus Hecatella orcuttiae]|jgi:nanoRNase/pAp phosphatase (c-di-AMP/oligoRNAs hydrolase)|uniref:DHH family phosphoesterase n=1 Tax=Candidatus Hecatella orcuttiae TaxID=1935119 RepID=UPI0028680DD0|nr:DHH family phosphoesterase [Candidatus Hecatella orcuttiae]
MFSFLAKQKVLRLKVLKIFLRRKFFQRALILCHHNADPDALFASFVFSKLLRRLRPGLRADIFAVQGPSDMSKLLMKHVPVKLVDFPKLKEADLLVLVDTSTMGQLDEWGAKVERSGKPLILVDHHTVHPNTRKLASLMLVDGKAKSACEIVYRLCRQAGLRLSKKEALGLFFGIAYETKAFRYATAQTFRILAELVGKGIHVEKALAAMYKPMSRSERIARLKAAERLQIHKLNEWLLAVSNVNSHQASAARGLLTLGCHVAVVGGEKKGQVRVSLRSTPDFYEETGIHLGRDVAMMVGEVFSGTGGGHPTSAGVNCQGDLNQILFEAVKLIKAQVG